MPTACQFFEQILFGLWQELGKSKDKLTMSYSVLKQHFSLDFSVNGRNLSFSQRELFYSVLENIRVIIRLNRRYCFPILDFR